MRKTHKNARLLEILLVEDNPADVRFLNEVLKEARLANRITALPDGDAALRYLRGQGECSGAVKPDLVLLDLNLPKLPGGEVLRAMKGDKALRGIPVVVLTTSEEESEISRCYAEGANCYIVKPVDFKSFMGIVSAIEEFWFSVVKLNDSAKTRRAAKPGESIR